MERAAIVTHQGVGLDVLHVGPGAIEGLITVFVVYCYLQRKQVKYDCITGAAVGIAAWIQGWPCLSVCLPASPMKLMKVPQAIVQ